MRIRGIKIWVLILSGICVFNQLSAQGVPGNLRSIPVYHPMVLNPAFAGSKDYTNIGITSRVMIFDSQLFNFHKRLTSADGEFSNLGMGVYAFQEQLEHSWNTGFALAGSYHYALDDERLHNISGAFSVKGTITAPKRDDEVMPDSATAIFHPDLDFGLYYYGPGAFAGISATSLFEGTGKDSVSNTYATIKRGYHLYGGYKFIVSKSAGIIIEPSLLVSVDSETITEPHKNLVPYLKVYLQNFYLGTYIRDFSTFALFFQYQFPKFYTGLFMEFPTDQFLNNDNIVFELTMGLNLGRGGRSFTQHRHW